MSRNISKDIEYDQILKEAEHKERKPVDRWFLNYCREYTLLCRGGVKRDSRPD